MRDTATVRRAAAGDIGAVADAFARASADEAVTAWVMAEDDAVAEEFRTRFAPRVIEEAIDEDEVWIAAEGERVVAVSIWRPVPSGPRGSTPATGSWPPGGPTRCPSTGRR